MQAGGNGGGGLSHPAYDGGCVTVMCDADQSELRNAALGLSRSGDPRLFSGLRRGRYWIHGRHIWAFKRGRQNVPLSIQPIDVRLALRLTIGAPEIVGSFANCLVQVWHDFSFRCPLESCFGKV